MKTILVIDASMTFLEYVSFLIHRLGFAPVKATTKAKGSDLLRKSPIDLVVLEARLPDGNGIEFCKEIKADPSLAHIPVLLISTDGSFQTQASAKAGGCAEYLTKPVRVRTLYLALERLLGHKRRKIRTTMTVPVSFTLGDQEFSAETLDVGEGGLFILSDRPLPVGHTLDLQLTIPESGLAVSAKGEIIYTFGNNADWHPAGMGIKFVNLDGNIQAALSRYLEGYLAGPHAPGA